MSDIESLIADLIAATNDIHIARERQAEAVEAIRDALGRTVEAEQAMSEAAE